MKKRVPITYFLLLVLFTSCASSYNAINTSQQNYVNKQVIEGYMEIGYKYDLYSSSDNKKYFKKEKLYGYKTIAIEIKNISSIPVLITADNFRVYTGEKEVPTVDLNTYLMNVKQLSGTYLLHGLWGPWSIQTWSDSNGHSGGKVTYLPVGLAIGIINAIIASGANKKHSENIEELNIFNKTIEPNEKITGIICLKHDTYDQLTFKYLE